MDFSDHWLGGSWTLQLLLGSVMPDVGILVVAAFWLNTLAIHTVDRVYLVPSGKPVL